MPSDDRRRLTHVMEPPGPAAKVSRLANAKEERKAQEGGETPETPLATEKIMHLLKDLWNDDKCVIARTLNEIASIATEMLRGTRKTRSKCVS